MKRDWRAAREKVDDEGRCRRCGIGGELHAAHVIPRSRVNAGHGAEDPRNILPLCPGCHHAQHMGHYELGPLLTNEEAAYAVELVGLGEAWRRLTGREAA